MKFYYHLAKCPPTYDFVVFLSGCDVLRESLGAPDMEIVIGPGVRNKTARDKSVPAFQRDWRTYQMLPQLAKLMPTVRAVSFGHQFGTQNPQYGQFPMPVRDCLRAPEYAVESVPFKANEFITLTVRQSDVQPERNTDPVVWGEALAGLPLPVVVVPDTEAEIRGEKCAVEGNKYAPAAFSSALRLALYEKARLNLFTTGGPMILALYDSQVEGEAFGLMVKEVFTCSVQHLMSLGLGDGAVFNRSVVHWKCTAEKVKGRITERLNEKERQNG